MIPTLWFDVILWFLVGSLVRGAEWVGGTVRPDRLGGRHLGIAAAALAVFALPGSVYSYVRAPDWAWMYWVDPRGLPGGVVLGASVVAFAAAFLAGALANRAATRRLGLVGGGLVHGVGVAGLAAVTLVGWSRLMRVGDAAAFAAGTATPLWQAQPLFPIFLAGGTGVGLAVAALCWHAGRRRAARDPG